MTVGRLSSLLASLASFPLRVAPVARVSLGAVQRRRLAGLLWVAMLVGCSAPAGFGSVELGAAGAATARQVSLAGAAGSSYVARAGAAGSAGSAGQGQGHAGGSSAGQGGSAGFVSAGGSGTGGQTLGGLAGAVARGLPGVSYCVIPAGTAGCVSCNVYAGGVIVGGTRCDAVSLVDCSYPDFPGWVGVWVGRCG
jgi:hypothetical protein